MYQHFSKYRDTSKQSIAKFISSGEWLASLKYMAAMLIFSLLEQMFLEIKKMFLGIDTIVPRDK